MIVCLFCMTRLPNRLYFFYVSRAFDRGLGFKLEAVGIRNVFARFCYAVTYQTVSMP